MANERQERKKKKKRIEGVSIASSQTQIKYNILEFQMIPMVTHLHSVADQDTAIGRNLVAVLNLDDVSNNEV